MNRPVRTHGYVLRAQPCGGREPGRSQTKPPGIWSARLSGRPPPSSVRPEEAPVSSPQAIEEGQRARPLLPRVATSPRKTLAAGSTRRAATGIRHLRREQPVDVVCSSGRTSTAALPRAWRSPLARSTALIIRSPHRRVARVIKTAFRGGRRPRDEPDDDGRVHGGAWPDRRWGRARVRAFAERPSGGGGLEYGRGHLGSRGGHYIGLTFCPPRRLRPSGFMTSCTGDAAYFSST